MPEWVRKTWLPTLLFAFPILAFEMWHGGVSPPPVGTMTVVALLVVPPTWWRATAGRSPLGVGRGALSGALCAALIVLLPAIYVVAATALKGPGEGLGGLSTAAGLIVLVGALVVLVPVGAGLGALVVVLQGRGPAERPS